MVENFIIYQVEGGGIGYKPAKVELPKGTRICLDKEKMQFAKVMKSVKSTAEKMRQAWNDSKSQSRYFGYNYFVCSFLGMFE